VTALLEQLFGFYVPSLISEAKRLASIKMLSFALEGFKAARKLMMLQYLALMASFLTIVGLFAIAISFVMQYQTTGFVDVDPIIVGGLILFALGALLFWWSVSEQRWIDALGFDAVIEQVDTNQSKSKIANEVRAGRALASDLYRSQWKKLEESYRESSPSNESLEDLMHRYFEKRFNELARAVIESNLQAEQKTKQPNNKPDKKRNKTKEAKATKTAKDTTEAHDLPESDHKKSPEDLH